MPLSTAEWLALWGDDDPPEWPDMAVPAYVPSPNPLGSTKLELQEVFA